jgi:hemolysin activation/secretion protein
LRSSLGVCVVGAASLCAALGPLQAQTVPDAGAIRQQIEQGRQPAWPQQQIPVPPASPLAPPDTSGVVVKLSAFRFSGNTRISSETLQAALTGYINQTLDYNQLQNAAALVAELYRNSGWVVRTFLPEQDIVNGVVTIQVVEAIFGGVRTEGPTPSRTSPAQVEDIVTAQQKVGELISADALDRALLLADDLPGVSVSGSLREGSQADQTELVLRFTDTLLFTGNVLLDNAGNRSTGAERLSASLNLNSALALGDLMSANLIHSEGSDYLRLDATVPVGSDGWRVGVNTSGLQYQLVLNEFAPLRARGTSESTGIEANYPMIRSRLRNLYFSFNADHKAYDNQANGGVVSHYSSDTLSLGLWGNSMDALGGGGANNASLTFTSGQLDLAGSPNRVADSLSTRTEGYFSKLRYSASRQQVLGNDVSAYAALSGQWADKNLDSSEKFYLGGANGVRAYPGNEAGGAEGQLLTLELRWRLRQGLQASAFYDVGMVSANHSNQFVGAPASNETHLKGAGLSLSWLGDSGAALKATWAQRLGDNPNATASGYDQDGSRVLDRFWLSASLPF